MYEIQLFLSLSSHYPPPPYSYFLPSTIESFLHVNQRIFLSCIYENEERKSRKVGQFIKKMV